VVSPETEQISQLQAENLRLRQERNTAEVREELARVMPYVLRPTDDGGKKGNAANSKPR
jgi:hypothetical protein